MFNRDLILLNSINPWRGLDQIVGGFLPDAFEPISRSAYPRVNFVLNDDGVELTAELPGVDIKDVEISVEGRVLTLSGERKGAEPKEGEVYNHRERWEGKFTRSFRLPFTVDAAKVTAKLVNGVLVVAAPKAEADKPRKITVTH